MIEQKKKLRLDDLQVDSFVTNVMLEKKGGLPQESYYCDGKSEYCAGTGTNCGECNQFTRICTELVIPECRALNSVTGFHVCDCPTGLLICNSIVNGAPC